MRKAGADMDDLFQSTLSMRRASQEQDGSLQARTISIHALHEESDRRDRRDPPIRVDFNPRSP